MKNSPAAKLCGHERVHHFFALKAKAFSFFFFNRGERRERMRNPRREKQTMWVGGVVVDVDP